MAPSAKKMAAIEKKGDEVDDFDALISSMQAANDAATANPLEYATFTALQHAWINMQGPKILLRAANQIGKSHATAAKMCHFVRRTGPYINRRPGPVRILVISTSKEQIVPLMEKMRDFFPPGEVCRDIRNDRGRARLTPLEFVDNMGFTGKPPRIYWHSGPGKGSTIAFATYKQGAGRIAGGTFDLVVCDEPLPKEIWDECQPRVLRRKGAIWVTFTPTPECCDIAYLRKMVADGETKDGHIKELHGGLTPETMRLVRRDGKPGRYLMTQEAIERYTASILPIARDMRINGSWDIVVTERHFMGWGEHCIAGDKERPPSTSILCVGMDHGLTSGRQAAVVIAINLTDPLMPEAWILGELRPEGYATPDTVAVGLLRLLGEVGMRLYGHPLAYDHVDKWFGDRAAVGKKSGLRMENDEIRRKLAKLLGREASDPRMKPMATPYKFGGSVLHGQSLMNAMMARRRLVEHGPGEPWTADGPSYFRVWKGCTNFIADIAGFKGDPKDPKKDLPDAARYPLEEVVHFPSFAGFRMIYA